MTIFWFRRDLRLNDNAGLYYALKNNKDVHPIFIFDKSILDKLESKTDARVTFIHNEIERLKKELQELGSDLEIFHDTPMEVFKKIVSENKLNNVYTNRDYEPGAIARDKEIYEFLSENNIELIAKKDQVIFDRNEILKDDNTPYTVYTPYSKKWKSKMNDFYLSSYPTEKYFDNLHSFKSSSLPALESLGFEKSEITIPSRKIDQDVIADYHNARDIPSKRGTTRLSVHLRFGTVSIRELAQRGLESNEKWLNELIWRDFYQTILYHFPYSVESSFKPKYDHIEWRNNEEEFKRWCKGKTGYPIVDAGMRELNQTGFMHNRVRMIVASFLTKHLLIDWKWGERYFAEKLLDYDLASNIGGWQWAAGSGCDAAPYFRVFNPYLQTERFDPKEAYIKKWVPEYESNDYPAPIVDHKFARQRAIDTYKKSLGSVN